MFNLESLCDDYIIHVSLFIINLRIFFLYFLKTQNDHVNLFINDGKVKYNIWLFQKKKCTKFIGVWSSIACHVWEYDVNQRGTK